MMQQRGTRGWVWLLALWLTACSDPDNGNQVDVLTP